MTVIKAQEELAIESIEELRRKLAAVTLQLRITQLDLVDAKDDLESSQADLDAALSNLEEKEHELEDTKVALANGELALVEKERELENTKVNRKCALQEANRNRVLARSPNKQEIFAVLKFRNQMLSRWKSYDLTIAARRERLSADER
ncbi:hypothetical protein BGX26_005733 [Mortierella sp. AD094]|nr:hypothetical protein BGX26_005733 [Mortierella sp. AD094]